MDNSTASKPLTTKTAQTLRCYFIAKIFENSILTIQVNNYTSELADNSQHTKGNFHKTTTKRCRKKWTIKNRYICCIKATFLQYIRHTYTLLKHHKLTAYNNWYRYTYEILNQKFSDDNLHIGLLLLPYENRKSYTQKI